MKLPEFQLNEDKTNLLSAFIKPRKDPNPLKPTFVVAVDFDGTCVTHEFPALGRDCPHGVDVLQQMVAHGAGLILFTMRHGPYLDEAIAWFANRNIPLYGIQINPTQASWTASTKCYAHLYIDDAALGCPLIYDASLSTRPFVDWLSVRTLLQQDWFTEPFEGSTYLEAQKK